ncbi:MAG TPA: hypothetical protein VFC26_04305, partial [Verrucomicrobiae bacterium]|nr:hypothetical protein [Verrucomicrobiae bacterium]
EHADKRFRYELMAMWPAPAFLLGIFTSDDKTSLLLFDLPVWSGGRMQGIDGPRSKCLSDER